jgi:hypothetical protein
MKKNFIFLILFFLLSACASPTPRPPVDDAPFDTPTEAFSTPELYVFPTITPTATPVSLEGVKFLTKFSDKQEDWQAVSGRVTAAQINAAVAESEGNVSRAHQKVINGFLRTLVSLKDGQVFEVLSPAEFVNGKLQEMKIKNVGQVPVLSSHALLLEDYFEINFPDVVRQWKSSGAADADLKYAAVITVTWATKYGPLRISYKMSGKYITEAGKYPGRLDFMRLCMFEQTQEHFLPNKRLGMNLYPVPIVGLSGVTIKGVTGQMKSDAFGWTPITDFAKAESETLNEIGQAVGGVGIESEEILAEVQSAFDRAFMPVHCSEAVIE